MCAAQAGDFALAEGLDAGGACSSSDDFARAPVHLSLTRVSSGSGGPYLQLMLAYALLAGSPLGGPSTSRAVEPLTGNSRRSRRWSLGLVLFPVKIIPVPRPSPSHPAPPGCSIKPIT